MLLTVPVQHFVAYQEETVQEAREAAILQIEKDTHKSGGPCFNGARGSRVQFTLAPAWDGFSWLDALLASLCPQSGHSPCSLLLLKLPPECSKSRLKTLTKS